jgi:endonuclease I
VRYNKARLDHLYPWVDLREPPGLRLESIYSGEEFDAAELIELEFEIAATRRQRTHEFMASEAFTGEASLEAFLADLEAAQPFNCEHVVPQSWFNKNEPMKGDLHHLFTCESDCNSFRSNIPYFQFKPEDEVFRAACGQREDAKFEPVTGKGAVARATLYFLLRYPQQIGDEERELNRERLESVLLQWHSEHGPDLWERHRNAEIAKIQGNRNPLIDHPQWHERINFRLGFGG